MPDDHIRYDLLVREALRGVVRRVVTDVARNGLPGEHHFYISFDTGAPGVRISPRLRGRYPEEMTIVLQHQFWDLSVTESAIEVGLSFDRIPEKLTVPFEAIKGFFDPSVQFGLEFEVAGEKAAATTEAPAAPAPVLAPPEKQSALPERRPMRERENRRSQAAGSEAVGERPAEKPEKGAAGPKPERGAEVVKLDRFRKK